MFLHEGKRRWANLQVLQKLSCAWILVVRVSDVVVQWVVLGYCVMDVDFPSFRSPHYNIIAQIDVATAVKLVALFSMCELLHPEGLQHLQNIKRIIRKERQWYPSRAPLLSVVTQ